MSTSRNINKICIVAVALMLVITVLFMNGSALGLAVSVSAMKYESTLFDTSYVHTIDIVMDDWDTFIENCESEEYSVCTVVVDGEKHANIAIRAKGNTSLSNVSSMGSQRYSFKLEFDHYENGKSLDGLDKLCLNNLIQDNTMMKDYIVYRMMNEFGVDSPLCSFAYLTVNGEDWGLYLAVEGIEDSFLERNYGSDTGELYKPDSMSFGGGRGNGKDFNMEDFDFDFDSEDADTKQQNETAVTDDTSETTETTETAEPKTEQPDTPETTDNGTDTQNPSDSGEAPQMPDGEMPDFDGEMPEMPDGEMPDFDGEMPDMPNGEMPQGGMQGGTPPSGGMPGGNTNSGKSSASSTSSTSTKSTSATEDTESDVTASASENTENGSMPDFDGEIPTMPNGETPDMSNFNGEMPDMSDFGGGGGMGANGSDDVKLKYIDDDADSYSNIFNSAKTDITDSDKERLIESLKNLSEYTDIENTVDVDEVLRYFVVHNFVCNGDSYTGSMIHNYYLRESDGQMSMIPWDYNLAFGTFQGNNAQSTVNSDIDSPVSDGDVDDRPMVGWIFSDEEYTEQYHELFSESIEKWFTNGELKAMIEETADMISEYVEKDPTKFCTTEEFESGVEALSEFVTLRAEAVSNQLAGNDTQVDTGDLNLSDMGTMGNTMGGGDNAQGMPGGDFGGGMNMNIGSMITVTDKDGNEVEISDVIGDASQIASVTLSDGSEIDISSSDMRTLMQTDFSDIVSVTDSNGNTTDVSEYTISVSTPEMPSGSDNANGGMPQGDGNEQSSETANPTPPDSQNADSAEASEGNTQQGQRQMPDNANTDGNTQGQRQMPGGQQGGQQGGMQYGGGDVSGDASGDAMQMPDGTSNSTSSLTTWILLGASLLILAVGLVISAKKK